MSHAEAFYRVFGIYPKERTQHKNFASTDIPKGITALPDVVTTPSLQDCIDSRALDLTKESNLCLLWSGGIDSTLAFYALIDANIPFEVYANDVSVAEHPNLAKKIKTGHFKLAEWCDLKNATNATFKDKAVVTGEIGDQCVGSDHLLRMTFDERSKDHKTKYTNSLLNVFSETALDILNRKSMTVGEMTWAYNFFWKYDEVTQRITDQLYDIDLHHFFNTELFQSYAMTNYEKSTAFKKSTDYKLAYKEWIYNHDADDFYLKNKLKIGSLKRLLGVNHTRSF